MEGGIGLDLLEWRVPTYLQCGQNSLPARLLWRLSSIQAMGVMETLWEQWEPLWEQWPAWWGMRLWQVARTLLQALHLYTMEDLRELVGSGSSTALTTSWEIIFDFLKFSLTFSSLYILYRKKSGSSLNLIASHSLSWAINPGFGWTHSLLDLRSWKHFSRQYLYLCIRAAITTAALLEVPCLLCTSAAPAVRVPRKVITEGRWDNRSSLPRSHTCRETEIREG